MAPPEAFIAIGLLLGWAVGRASGDAILGPFWHQPGPPLAYKRPLVATLLTGGEAQISLHFVRRALLHERPLFFRTKLQCLFFTIFGRDRT